MSILLSNAKIIDGLGAAFDDHALLIDGEHIADIGPSARFEGFGGQQIDLSGCTLLPGLIDCHVHMLYGAEPNPGEVCERMGAGQVAIRGLRNARQSVEGGITAVRDCGGIDYLEFAIRDACNRGDFTGPTMRAAGRVICMTGGHGNRFGRIADGVDSVVQAVREQIHAGSDLIKIMATGGVMTPGVNPEDAHYSPEEMAAGVAEGHRFHKTCASHAQGTEGILNAVRAGIDSIEHGIFMSEHCIEEMIERGTYLVPTLAALANISANADKGIPEYVVDKCARIGETHTRSVQAFYQAGGKIAMGTDAGTPFNFHGDNALELKYMVDIGIAPMDAIVFSTSHGADLMRLDDHGRLEAGAIADLLIVEGDPLERIDCVATKDHHRGVLKRGRIAAGQLF